MQGRELLALFPLLRAALHAVVTARALLILKKLKDSLLVLEHLPLQVILGVLDDELLGRGCVDVDLVIVDQVEGVLRKLVVEVLAVVAA